MASKVHFKRILDYRPKKISFIKLFVLTVIVLSFFLYLQGFVD